MISQFVNDLPTRGPAAVGLLADEASGRKARKLARKQINKRFSATTVIDLHGAMDGAVSISVGSGVNQVVGGIVDLQNSDNACNLFIMGNGVAGGSGPIQVQIQTAAGPNPTSGSFVDATSGVGVFPGTFVSGGNIFFNSGLFGSGNTSDSAPVNNQPLFCSGGWQASYFQRPQRYVRAILVSGSYPGPLTIGFLSNKKETGSGGGVSQLPGSGTVSV